MWQGGNQWSAWDSFLTFFRHVAKLDLDYSKYDSWEKLALHSGPRIMHPEFCMISDRPELLRVDERNRPHCMQGPFCRWRDGSELYAIHGVRVPEWVAMTKPEDLDVKEVLSIKDVDIRVRAIQKIGPQRMIKKLGAKTIATKKCKVGGLYELLEVDWTDSKRVYLKMTNQSTGEVHIEAVPPECETVDMAEGSRNADIIGEVWKKKNYKHQPSLWLT
jgi:hypothetical protein